MQVGNMAITKATLEHWTSVIAGGPAQPGTSKRSEQALRQQGLSLLIASDWLIGQAADQGLRISGPEIQQRIAENEKTAFPGGDAEVREFLKATHQTNTDLELMAKAELASSKLRWMVTSAIAHVTQARIAQYYWRHRQRFAVPETREMLITNRKSAAAVETLKKEVKRGKSFAALSEREHAEPPRRTSNRKRNMPLEEAIGGATLNVLTGPVKQGVDYFAFEVKKILPATYHTLAQVEGAIRTKLIGEARRGGLATFITALRAKWVARTDCHPGYVVQKCSQYKGPEAPEDPFNVR